MSIVRLTALVALSLSLLSAAFAQDVKIPSADELRELLKPIPPRSPEEERAVMKIIDGLAVELVAAEPDVVDPIDIAFDAHGRMYVVEMTDYPFGAESPEQRGRIRVLRDRDGDGRYETSTVFAEGLNWPTSVAPWQGGVLVLSPPVMLFLQDTDGDDRADVREVWLRGLGTQNVQALANGLLWSVDCRFYFANGRNGGQLVPEGRLRFKGPLAMGSNDVRFLPPDLFELTTGGGQFGHTVDDFGRRFICNNSDHARFVVLERKYLARNPYLAATRLVDSIAVEGASAVVYRISPPEPWRVIRTRLRVAGLVPGPVEHGGKAVGYFTSATGITLYRGDALGPDFYGNLFIGDVAGNLVHRKKLEPHGATFRARRTEQGREFLACADLWFRPVNFATGPDGALYVCDMYREVVEHPASIPDFMKAHMDLTRGRDRGRIWRVRREGSRPRPAMPMASLESRELVELLDSPNGWVRDTAQRLLVERGDRQVVPQLLTVARHCPRPAAQVAALWLLERLGGLKPGLLRELFGSSGAEVREHVVRLVLEKHWTDQLASVVLQAAQDPAPRVRLYAAYALGEVNQPAAAKALARLLQDPNNDEWIRLAALSSCSPVPSAKGRPSRAYEVLRALLEVRGQQAARAVRELAALLAAAARADELAVVWTDYQASPLMPVLVLGTAEGATRGGRSLSELFSNHPEALRLYRHTLEHAAKRLAEGRADSASVTLLAYAPNDMFRSVAEGLLEPQVNPALQQHFIRVAGRVRRDRWYEPVLERWANLTPAVRRTVAEALLARPASALAFLAALREGKIRPADVDPDVRNRLRRHRDARVREAATELLGRGNPASDRNDLVQRYIREGALGQGDPQRGEQLYEEHCAKCHGELGKGGGVGPDLNTIRNRDPESLLIAILDPNREVAPEYLSYVVLLADGRVLNGRILSETGTALTIGKADGSTETILRQNIEALRASGQSLMPEGFEEQLSPQDVADLISFLLGRR